ncbi:MAG TPA: HAMP domain-containing sensor histidine kinase [Propionicimonas sp.]|nr:HAMP domain-containing sensor histidine kinase [Propionicimonas sp.]
MTTLSLRARLVLGMVLLMAAGLIAAQVAGIAIFRAVQLQRIDETLQAPFQSGTIPKVLTRLSEDCDTSRIAGGLKLPGDYAVVLTDEAGAVTCTLAQNNQSGGPVLELDGPALARAAAENRVVALPGANPDGAGWRATVSPIDGGYAIVAISLASTKESVARLTLISVLVSLGILLIATLAGLMIVSVALRPLTAIEGTAQEIAAGDFSRTIAIPAPHTEVGHLASALNAMLSELRGALDQRDATQTRLRRFVADASHELRTPLTTIRGHAELLRDRGSHDPADVERSISRIEAESRRLSVIVDDLLLLARLDDVRELTREPIDVLAIATESLVDARVREPGRVITLQHPTAEPWLDVAPTVLGQEGMVRQVLTNLLANALKYTPVESPIVIEVGVRHGEVVVSVIDRGPGLPPGSEAVVFERFQRADAGRARSQGGAGLGLAIAAGIAERHDGSLSYEPTPGGGATFRLRLPHQDL